jgi:diaminopimelate decarboxylase/aspartate kinase
LVETKSTPLYVYNLSIIEEKANELLSLQGVDQIFYAIKANPHPDILRLLYHKGFGFEVLVFLLFFSFLKIDLKCRI